MTLVGTGGRFDARRGVSHAPLPLGAPRRACISPSLVFALGIRPSLCFKRVPRFKQQRPACGGVFNEESAEIRPIRFIRGLKANAKAKAT